MTNKYIPYEHAIKVFNGIIQKCETVQEANALFKVKEAVTAQVCNLIDLQPVKHGTWEHEEQGYDVYAKCSECGKSFEMSNYIENEWREILKYCPCCGAKMDGDIK